ncbi:hypothetical protein [Elioraea tepidiphila]|jgi:hypothetical protein|uniref:hypothetical protein n=1 Tax=Elioraea tepidiphila TaxID=457934 RepID=UPI002FD9B9F5
MTKLLRIGVKLPAFVVAAIAVVAVSLVWIAHRETSNQLLAAASDKLAALRTARAEAITSI